VRVRDHILLSTAGAALLAPSLGPHAVGLWAGGVLIDLDHYLWFCIRRRHLSLPAAVRFFDGAHPPQTAATRVLHHPMTVLGALALAARRRQLWSIAVGMSLHVGLDAQHEVRMNRARAAALERDRFSCQRCGARVPQVDTHVCYQPLLFPSYRSCHFISLCAPCHELAHASPEAVRKWR
jgi:hypothetical protein